MQKNMIAEQPKYFEESTVIPHYCQGSITSAWAKGILRISGSTLDHAVILCGPKASGKTTCAQALAKKLGCGLIIDDATHQEEWLPGTLVIAQYSGLVAGPTDKPIYIDEALKLLKEDSPLPEYFSERETILPLTQRAEQLGVYCPMQDEAIGQVDGYEALQLVLSMAYQQAACGKGKDRHAGGMPFHEQPMQRESDDIGSWDGLIFQARKKVREGIALPTADRQIKELLGAIVYLSGAVIWELRQDR